MKVKYFLYLSIILLFSALALAQDEWDISRDEIIERAQGVDSKRRLDDIKILQQAKFALISGHPDRALVLFSRMDNKKSPLEMVAKRYQAMTYFIKGDYERSLDVLKDRRFYGVTEYPQICLIKTLDLFALKKTKEAKEEYDICNPVTFVHSPNRHIWMDNIFELLTRDRKDRTKFLQTNSMKAAEILASDPDMIRLWLKMGLFMNRENYIIKEFPNIPEESYSSQKVRELMGFVFYRNGQADKALTFIEDISTANSENIKGNINLEKKEYELAFGHFKLALKQKENSHNAIERAIPLSWILEQWEDGVELIAKYRDASVPEVNKITVDTAFQIKLKHIERAERQLIEIRKLFNNSPPREVLQMESYVAMILSRNDRLERFAEDACRRLDGINCYTLMQMMIWEDLGKLSVRPDKTYADKEITLESLKAKEDISPFKEDIFIEQRDIEELDDAELGIRVK